jgi:hypothetical protein
LESPAPPERGGVAGRTLLSALLVFGELAACKDAALRAPSASSAPRPTIAVVPEERDGRYFFRAGDVSFEVDPRVGARVTSLRIAGREFLSGPEVNPNNYGSTFWTSPQVDWDWPPPSEIDRGPYRGGVQGSVLTLTSPACPLLGVKVTKSFSVDAADVSIAIAYTIENLADAPRKFAPWEITRVPLRGVTFFPSGERVYGSGPFAPLSVVRRSARHTWFEFEAQGAKEPDQELFADGAGGFLAHADDGAVLVKVFDDVAVAEQAPGEGEIEIYVHANPDLGKRYMELEIQGPYRTLPARGASTWKAKWYLKRYPAGARAAVFDTELVDYVERLVASSGNHGGGAR